MHIYAYRRARAVSYIMYYGAQLSVSAMAMQTLSQARETRKSLNEMDEPRKARKNTELNSPLREEGQESPNWTNEDE